MRIYKTVWLIGRDYTQINFGIQIDWGIEKDNIILTINFLFWSLEGSLLNLKKN